MNEKKIVASANSACGHTLHLVHLLTLNNFLVSAHKMYRSM